MSLPRQSSNSEFSVREGFYALWTSRGRRLLWSREDAHTTKTGKWLFRPGYFIQYLEAMGLTHAVGKSSKQYCKLAILDGDDDERFYPSSTTRLKHFGPSRWLRKLLSQKTSVYFKREWTNKTNQWPYTCCIKPLSFQSLKKNTKQSIP